MPWAKRAVRPTPTIRSRTSGFESNDYSLGMNSFIGNDKFPVKNGASNYWRLAQDARITTLGEYETRKGFDILAEMTSLADQANTQSTAPLVDYNFSQTNYVAQTFAPTTTSKLSKVTMYLKNTTGATGTVLIELWSNVGGKPGVMIERSSIAAGTIVGTYSYFQAYFIALPQVTAATQYWLVAHIQSAGSGSYQWRSNGVVTNQIQTSTDNGMTWSPGVGTLNYTQSYVPVTTSGVKGLYRSVKSDGTKTTIMAYNQTLIEIADNGSFTIIKSDLNIAATNYRFQLVNDILYYVNSYDGYRKWNGVTESQVVVTNYSDILLHKGLIFLVRADDPSKLEFSNFGLYETFTSTDFIYVPAPKTGDIIASIKSLNGYLLIRTRNRCYILSGTNNSTFTLDDAPDQKGTFGTETSVNDKNYNYFLSDDGVYRSNGSQPELISDNIYNDIKNLANKSTCCMAINRGRLYLWYRKPGTSVNNSCYVWNLNIGKDCVESLDTNAYVNRAANSARDDDQLIVGSSLGGYAYWQELASNDYTNLGGDINFELRSHYYTGSSPAILSEVRYWEPRFAARSGNYTVDCDYAYELRDNWLTYASPNVQGAGSIWGQFIWGAGATWGSTAEFQAQLYIPGEYRRYAVRYKKYSTRQPNKFLGHSLVFQERRMR